MRTDEVYGKGNLNTAEYWEYDTRVARRWNLDPVDQISISNYAVFGNNPIFNVDVLGNEWYKAKDGSARYSDKKLSRSERKADGLKYLGKTFSGYDDNGRGVSGSKDGIYNVSDNIPEVTITAQRNNSEQAGKNIRNGTRMVNYPMLDVDFEIYGGATIKKTEDIGIKAGLKVNTIKIVAPMGGQIGYRTGVGGYANTISPDAAYINWRVTNGLDLRVMPVNGVMRGDYNPGARSLITIGNFWKVGKVQLDMGLNARQLTLGGRAVVETPTEIMGGLTIPYSLEANLGARLIFTPVNPSIQWER